MMDQRHAFLPMFLSMVLMVLLIHTVYTPSLGPWLPRFLELCACYWIVSSPNQFGLVFAFLVGALVSWIDGSFIGSASMGLSVVAYVLLGNILKIRQLDGISQTILIFLLMSIYLALHSLVLSVIGVPSSGMSYLISAAVSAVCWRPFCLSLDRARLEFERFL